MEVMCFVILYVFFCLIDGRFIILEIIFDVNVLIIDLIVCCYIDFVRMGFYFSVIDLIIEIVDVM